MAARENQGLQIALIIFVILSIATSVTTYLAFTNFKEKERQAAAEVQKTSEITAKKDAADKEIAELKQFIGQPEDIAKVREAFNKKINDEFAPLGLTALPEDQRNMLKVIEQLMTTIRTKNDTVFSRDKDKSQIAKQLLDDKAKAEAKLKEVEAARDAAVKTLQTEQKNYNDAVKALTTEKDKLVDDKAELNKQKDALKAEYEGKLTALAVQLNKANDDVAKLKKLIVQYSHFDPSSSGGRITWINQRDNMAYLNLGSDDGLHRRISFSVYPAGTTDVDKATAKGKIEVINVTGPHESEARIIDNPINNPLLPGDLVHTQGWHPGQHEHFGIVGFVDIDGNGVDQTKKLHDLILANGGFVDAEIIEAKGPDGKPVLKPNGSLTVNTRYLIKGEMSADTPAKADRIGPSTTIIKEAEKLNVETIGLQKFLGLMGYTPRSSAAGGAAAPAGAGAAAGADDNGGFRPRKPPARGKDDSAF